MNAVMNISIDLGAASVTVAGVLLSGTATVSVPVDRQGLLSLLGVQQPVLELPVDQRVDQEPLPEGSIGKKRGRERLLAHVPDETLTEITRSSSSTAEAAEKLQVGAGVVNCEIRRLGLSRKSFKGANLKRMWERIKAARVDPDGLPETVVEEADADAPDASTTVGPAPEPEPVVEAEMEAVATIVETPEDPAFEIQVIKTSDGRRGKKRQLAAMSDTEILGIIQDAEDIDQAAKALGVKTWTVTSELKRMGIKSFAATRKETAPRVEQAPIFHPGLAS
ncbi:MAG TPA: hypothetical protein VIL88_02470 [Devosia sp.]|jgi:hypothetical protein|uniref:hypothetical protein n=1 Tax=Devosia sp. TaxID=1871048 RepID=UPI002F931867